MRSSFFITPKHYSKVCDIASESVVQLYTNMGDLYYSDIFSYIMDGVLYVNGWVSSNNHFSYDTIKSFVVSHIGVDITVIILIKQNELDNSINVIGSGTFLGYSTNETACFLPFEHDMVRELTKFIYNEFEEKMRVNLTINGDLIRILVETDIIDKSSLEYLILQFFKNKQYGEIIIDIVGIEYDMLYKSDANFISNTYGPRSPYGNTRYVGIDVHRNLKYSHWVVKEIADNYLQDNGLNYSLVELTYSSEKEIPTQFALKGNIGGIHIENGTFFEYISDYDIIDITKNTILNKIKENPIGLIEMAKWGYFNYE
jgi:S-adenosylmethionine synthetase